MTGDKKDYILSDIVSMRGHQKSIGFGNEELCVKVVNRDYANNVIIKNHYSKKFYKASYIHLGVFAHGDIVGVLQYGYAMNPASQNSVVSNTNIDEYLELNRMWFKDGLDKNIKSKTISYSIKYIKKEYPKIKWIQSFADERCSKYGIVYQASNFKYFGEHSSIFWEINGEYYHNSMMTRNPNQTPAAKFVQDNKKTAKRHVFRQFRYIYFINKKVSSDCLLEEKPYPKHYVEDDEK